MQTHMNGAANKMRRRQTFLRQKLEKHFQLPPERRNYREFERIADELSVLRGRLTPFKLTKGGE